MKYIDLSHTFVDHMPVFPGDPETILHPITSIEKEGYTDHQLTTVMHVGTHIDAPLHMIVGGKRVSDIPVERFTGPGVLLDVKGKTRIDISEMYGKEITEGSIVLLYTGCSDTYGTPDYNHSYPSITKEFANELVKRKVKILGMDMINPDVEETFPIHKILLADEVLIIENLTNISSLLKIPEFQVFAFPVKLNADAASVRVIAGYQ